MWKLRGSCAEAAWKLRGSCDNFVCTQELQIQEFIQEHQFTEYKIVEDEFLFKIKHLFTKNADIIELC